MTPMSLTLGCIFLHIHIPSSLLSSSTAATVKISGHILTLRHCSRLANGEHPPIIGH